MTHLADASFTTRLVDRRFWLAMMPCLLAFAICHAMDYALPGLYMDVVNPDFAGVLFFASPYLPQLDMHPGNLPFGRVPVLTALYHGSLHAWMGAPFFYLFGTSLETLRVVHGLCAMAVLSSAGLLLRHFSLPLPVIALALIGLAIDPAFVFAFRTQNYITTFPATFLLVSFVVFMRARRDTLGTKGHFLSGVLAGLAVYGYFIYAFFLPVFIFLLLARKRDDTRARRWHAMAAFAAGVAAGCAFYIAGYALMLASTGGVNEFLSYLIGATTQLRVVDMRFGFLERIDLIKWFFDSIAQVWWNTQGMLGIRIDMPFGAVKSALLLCAPVALLALSKFQRDRVVESRALVAMIGAFFLGALAFGPRLAGHHFVVAYLLCLLSLAAALYLAWLALPRMRKAVALLASIILLAWCTQSAALQQSIREELRRTGGFGMFSDSINQFAAAFLQSPSTTALITPDWGFFAPMVYFSAGSREVRQHLDPARDRQILCSGRDLMVVLAGNDARIREIDVGSKLGIGAIARREYRQRDGRLAFTVSTWRANRSSAICEATN